VAHRRTKSQTGDQLDDYLEQRAAKVETEPGVDSTTVSWSCLKEDFDDVFRVFEDVLKNPEFRAEKIEIAQKGLYDGISRRNDDPGQIAGREAAKLAYGAKNPYARVAEYATVAAIARRIWWSGTASTYIPTTSSSAWSAISTRRRWKLVCALRLQRGLGAGGERAGDQARACEAGILRGR